MALRKKHPITRLLLSVLYPLSSILLLACEPLEAQPVGDGANLTTGGDAWEYPYHLVIGGGLSETLSVLSITGDDAFSLAADAAPTGQAITQTVRRGDAIFAVCSLSNSVVIYDAGDLSLDRELSVGEGVNPMAIAFDDEGLAWLPGFVSRDVRALDIKTGEIVAAVPLPPVASGDGQQAPRPSGATFCGGRVLIAAAPMDAQFVGDGPGVVVAVDPAARAVSDVATLGGENAIAIHCDGGDGGERAIVSTAGKYDAIAGGFTGDGGVEVLDAASLTSIARVPLAGAPFDFVRAPWGVWYFENGKEGTILAADLDAFEALAPVALPGTGGPGVSFASALAADGRGHLFAAEFNADRLFVLDANDGHAVVASFDGPDGPDTLLLVTGE
ncbi:hypothetical protein K8I61_13420 [bacterium]|nr:hypothetical protein [bacterium]